MADGLWHAKCPNKACYFTQCRQKSCRGLEPQLFVHICEFVIEFKCPGCKRIDGRKQLKFIAQPNQGTLVVSKPPLLALLTNVGNKSTTTTSWTIPGSEGLYMSGEDIVNVLDCKVYQADKEGGISVQVDSGMPQVRWLASFS